jgi:serine/threonine protein kinase
MDVAVKVIHASLMQSMDRRKVYQDTFIDEATLMMRLKHPNLQTMEGA